MARLRGKRWLADFRTETGERLRPSFDTQAQAEEWEKAAKDAKIKGQPIPQPLTTCLQGITPQHLATLGPLYDYVVKTVWSKARGSVTQIKNGKAVVDFFGRHKSIDKITTFEITGMRSFFLNKGNAPATTNRKAAALSRMLRTALECGILKDMPKFNWAPEGQSKFRYLDEQEEDVLLDYWQERKLMDMHDLCVLLLDTGGRCYSEVMTFKWEDVRRDYGAVTFWETKTGKPRTVPLTQRAQGVLKRRYNSHRSNVGPFTNVSRFVMRHKWDEMRVATGFHDVTPHTLRHTCCTKLVLGGVDVKRVMTWMGHSAMLTTMRYMQIKPTALESVVNVLENRRR
ncbi:site-specific integrase [Brucella sp.]|uniref:tyrosine-type recombinase/integrase n=1 Tax=Brucella sp. TaxID=52132 RepID=UPI0028B15BB4|nr:site-specific integrase [Brucella sp.]